MLVNVVSGAIAQRVRYDAWGVPTYEVGSASTQPFGFAGGLTDADTRLVHFGARDYDASVGRWISKDPSRFDGGTNFYAYADNAPTNRIDPDGEFPVDPITSAVCSLFPEFCMDNATLICLLGGVGSCLGATTEEEPVPDNMCGEPRQVSRKKKKDDGCKCLCNNVNKTPFSTTGYMKCQELCAPTGGVCI
jgi:RHS repeat-associated protein